MCDVDTFLDHAPRLLDQLRVDDGKERRVVADVVFNDQQDGHADGTRIVQHVALVFNVFHEGDQDAGVALPQKNSFDVGDRIARDEVLYFAIVVGQHDHGHIQAGAAHLAGEVRGVGVAHGEVGDDQIELRVGACDVERFGATGDVGDARNLLEVEFEGFVDQEFVEASVFAENERVVEAGD